MDLIASLFFFMVIIISMLWLWETAHRHMTDYRDLNARQTRLMDVSSMLVKTQGNPPDWENGDVTPANVKALGLAAEGNVLDERKLDALEAADYQSLREIMGFGSENFTITVAENYSGAPVVKHSAGAGGATGERFITRRYALLNGTPVELKIEAYYNRR